MGKTVFKRVLDRAIGETKDHDFQSERLDEIKCSVVRFRRDY